MAEADEMAGGRRADLDIVDEHSGHTLDRGTDGHHRDAQIAQRRRLVRAARSAPSTPSTRLCSARVSTDARMCPGRTQRIQQQVVALLREHLLGTLDDRREEPPGNPGRDHADRVGPPGGQRRRGRRRE